MAYERKLTSDDNSHHAALRAIQNRLFQKATQHLLGLCSGLIADGQINDAEILFLRTWLAEHSEVTNQWPGKAIAARIESILADGIVTAVERHDLLETLKEITGNRFIDTGAAKEEGPMLPIDDDPSIFFQHMSFCFTGKFLYGTRSACERAVLELGAMPVDHISKRLDYLVIGALIEEQWFNTTYGRKIEAAVKHRDEGSELTIVSETQWCAAIEDANRDRPS